MQKTVRYGALALTGFLFAMGCTGDLTSPSSPSSPSESADAIEKARVEKIEALLNETAPKTSNEALVRLHNVVPDLIGPIEATSLVEANPIGAASYSYNPCSDDNGNELFAVPLSTYYNLRAFGPHWGYGGPRVGCITHANVVVNRYYNAFGYWSNGRYDQLRNYHISAYRTSSSRCLYIWDSRTSRESNPCIGGGTFASAAVLVASSIQTKVAADLGVTLTYSVALSLAYILTPLLLAV